MRDWTFSFFAVALAVGVLASLANAAEPQTWELRNGRYWEQVKHPSTAPVTDAVLDRIQQLVEDHQDLPAKKLASFWLRSHKDSPLRDRALYLLGQANFRYGDRIASFYNFDELLDKYPASPFFHAALDRQYEIADAFLRGYKRRLLGIPLLGAEDEAVEMLYRIQQRSPGSPLAEKALLRTGDYYYEDSQFDLAGDVYTVFLKSFPRSPSVPMVRLRQAFSNYAQFNGLRFDATPMIDARAELVQVQAAYPQLARKENIGAVIAQMDANFARELYLIADFYRRTHELKAAVYNYSYLVNTYPNTFEATQARTELARMPKWAQNVPQPPAGVGYAPATQPSDLAPKGQ